MLGTISTNGRMDIPIILTLSRRHQCCLCSTLIQGKVMDQLHRRGRGRVPHESVEISARWRECCLKLTLRTSSFSFNSWSRKIRCEVSQRTSCLHTLRLNLTLSDHPNRQSETTQPVADGIASRRRPFPLQPTPMILTTSNGLHVNWHLS